MKTWIFTLVALAFLVPLTWGQDNKKKKAKPVVKPVKKKKPTVKKSSPVAIVGADIYTATKGVIREGTVVVENGKITRLGRRVKVPAGARIIQGKGKVVIPGLVSLAISGVGIRPGRGNMQNRLNPFDEKIKYALASGITTTFQEDPSRGVMSNQNIIIKMDPSSLKGMYVRRGGVVRLNYIQRGPVTREKFRNLLDQARDYVNRKKPMPKKASAATKVAVAILLKRYPVWAAAQSKSQIRKYLKLAEEYDLQLVIQGATEGWTVAKDLALHQSKVIISPRVSGRGMGSSTPGRGGTIENAARLHNAGVPVAIVSPSPGFSMGGIAGYDLFTLLLDGGFAIRGGLPSEDALRALTIVPARMLGLQSRLGSIEVGKDGDLVILSGDPFSYRTWVEYTVVNGKVVYEKKKSTQFKHIPVR